jgi:transcriptional regulator with XRE-family HTH domain
MTTLQYVRNSLGLTVVQLANYLRVTPSQITMSQSGRRSLPSHAAIRLTRLLTALQAVSTREMPSTTTLGHTTNIPNKIIDLTIQLHKVQEKLADMQQQYLQAQTFLQVKTLLQEQPTTDALEPLWLEAIAADAATQIDKNSLEQQALLAIDGKVLAYKIELLKAIE